MNFDAACVLRTSGDPGVHHHGETRHHQEPPKLIYAFLIVSSPMNESNGNILFVYLKRHFILSLQRIC